jgi:hypothetical protein
MPLFSSCYAGNLHAAYHQICWCVSVVLLPGGLSFTLRVEVGAPGRPTGIETFTQVAPVLLAGPRAAEAGPYVVDVRAPSVSGVVSQLTSVLPGEKGQQLQQGLKTAGHKLANLLARV